MQKLTVQKDEDLDWYVVAYENSGYLWFESGSAIIEGNYQHMLEMAEAIFKKSKSYRKRCAVSCEPSGVVIWSPRNSLSNTVKLTYEEAEYLAKNIQKEIIRCANVPQ